MAVIPIFISSTFKDFHLERDALVGPIREALDDHLGPYGCNVEFVDLRWGVTDSAVDEDTQHRRVLEVCLGEIERSRPLFLGLVGDRIGWIPPPLQTEATLQAAGVADELADAIAEGWSMTTLEIEFGAFRASGAGGSALMIRNLVGKMPDGWVDADQRQIERLVSRARSFGLPTVGYDLHIDDSEISALDPFTDAAQDLLRPLVTRRAQEISGGSALDEYAAAEGWFITDRARTTVGRDAVIADAISRCVRSQGVCLAGTSGVGKSAVWAAAVQDLRRRGHTVASHVVGATPRSASARAVVEQLASRLGLSPAESDDESLFRWWTGALSDLGPCIIAVDGLDRIADAEERDRLPFVDRLPAHVSVLCTTTDSAQTRLLEARGAATIVLGPLAPDQSAGAVARAAARFGRTVPPRALAAVAREPRTGLWIRLAIDHLLGLGAEDFATVDEAPDPRSALDELLVNAVERLPSDDRDLATSLLDRAASRTQTGSPDLAAQILATSRSGLAPSVIAGLSAMSTADTARFRLALGAQVRPADAEGRLRFDHDIVRQAALHRTDVDPVAIHSLIAHHHAPSNDVSETAVDDFVWHALLAADATLISASFHRAQETDVERHRELDMRDLLRFQGDATSSNRTWRAMSRRMAETFRVAVGIFDVAEATQREMLLTALETAVRESPGPDSAVADFAADLAGQSGRWIDGDWTERLTLALERTCPDTWASLRARTACAVLTARSGNFDAVAQHTAAALGAIDRMHADDTNTVYFAEIQSQLAQAQAPDDHDMMIRLRRGALDAIRWLDSMVPSVPEVKRDVGVHLNNYGAALLNGHRVREAMSALLAAERTCRWVVAADPDDEKARFVLSLIYRNLTAVGDDEDISDGATPVWARSARDELDALSRLDANPDLHPGDVYGLWSEAGRDALSRNDDDGARRAFAMCESAARSLVKADPTVQHLDMLVRAVTQLAAVDQWDDPTTSLATCARASEVIEALAGHGADDDLCRIRTSEILEVTAGARLTAGDHEQAASVADEALSLCAPITDTDRIDDDLLTRMVLLLHFLITANHNAGTWTGSVDTIRDCATFAERLTDPDARNVLPQMIVAECRRALIEEALLTTDEVPVESLEDCAAILRSVRTATGPKAWTRVRLILVLDHLGAAYEPTDPQRAAAVYEESLSYELERLADDPDDESIQRDVDIARRSLERAREAAGGVAQD